MLLFLIICGVRCFVIDFFLRGWEGRFWRLGRVSMSLVYGEFDFRGGVLKDGCKCLEFNYGIRYGSL